MAQKKPENLSFEESMSELNHIVSAMEQGDLPLEEALKQFERGIALANSSAKKLDGAQQKVNILMNNDLDAELTPFEGEQ